MSSEANPASLTDPAHTKRRNSSWPCFAFLFTVVVPVLAAALVYHLDSFDPAPLPSHELNTGSPLTSPLKHDRILQGSEYVGEGQLKGPEDIAYDSKSGLIYTTCLDGWVKRIRVNDPVNDSVVESWVNTGGRPLGLVLGHWNEVIVADAFKGLLNISASGTVELLTNQAEGLGFKLTDGVDIAEDGTIYFTDASYKYNIHQYLWDTLEGRPYGRIMSYDPATRQTKVLARDLYFPNGLSVSPDQESVVFCETPLRRCRKLYIQGNKKGHIEQFLDNLPGLPDNIRYDHGQYWIGLFSESTKEFELALRYPVIRKIMAIMVKYNTGIVPETKNGGVLVVDLDGKLTAHYSDPGLSTITVGKKIGNHLYYGSFGYPYIIRHDLHKHPAYAAS